MIPALRGNRLASTLAARPAERRKLRQGVVNAVAAGPPPTLTVTLSAGSVQLTGVRYFASYSPVVGDTVWLEQNGTDLIATGILAPGPAWVNATLQNGWANFDPTNWTVARYRRSAMGEVIVQGLIKSGTFGTTALTLPAGFRPALKLMYPAVDGTNTGQRVDVNNDGTVVPIAGTTNNNGYFTLSAIRFLAEQ
jgi:hypothetical protein